MIPLSKKEEIVQRLLRTKEKAHKLEIRLLLKNESEKAAEVRKRSTDLRKQIDRLLGSLMDDWQGQAARTNSLILAKNTSLQNAIREIKQNIRTAENIVKAVGLIDDVISIAKGFV